MYPRFGKPAGVGKFLRAPLTAPVIRSRAGKAHHSHPLFGGNHRRLSGTGQVSKPFDTVCQKPLAPFQTGLPTQASLFAIAFRLLPSDA